MAGALEREGMLVFRPELNGILLQARRIEGTFTSYGNKARAIHRNVVTQMAKTAAERIDERPGPTVRPRDMRSGRLRAAVENPNSHKATTDGFVFLDYDAMYKQVVYWRLIEEGTRRFLGQYRRFVFLSGRTGRPVKPNMGRRGQDTVIIGEEGLPAIRIKTPIAPHHYAQYAVEQFERGNFAGYKAQVQDAAASLGLKLVIS